MKLNLSLKPKVIVAADKLFKAINRIIELDAGAE